MANSNGSIMTIDRVTLSSNRASTQIELPEYDKSRFEEVGFLTAMTLVLLGNYSQTGHFGGPLAYTPYTVMMHLAGPENGGLRYDYRRPKHPYADRFMLAGGHNAPVAYALWMIMGEALARKYAKTGDPRYSVDHNQGMLSIDCLGFRRGKGALDTLLEDFNLTDAPEMAQAKIRGIRALAGHSETTDMTNDVNGGPSGIGIATAAGKAAFWDMMGAPDSLKIMALEGEFAMTSGHSQEMKTQAVAQQVGKRLRILLSYNNAGIDDQLIGGVIQSQYDGYRIEDQWAAYGWNVFTVDNGNDYDQVLGVLKAMEDWDPTDDRPMIVVGNTVKGWWPGAVNGSIAGYGDQIISYASHPYAFPSTATTSRRSPPLSSSASAWNSKASGAETRQPTRANAFLSSSAISMWLCPCSTRTDLVIGSPTASSKSETVSTTASPCASTVTLTRSKTRDWRSAICPLRHRP